MAEVIGAIRDKWLALGGEGVFGAAQDIERPTFDGIGRAQEFAGGGTISWHPELGAFAVYGAIGEKWRSVGREQWGYPINDETGCPDGRGRFNHFRAMQLPDRPESAIYWTPQTAAHEVHGAIYGAWASHHWERSEFGYPTSDEYDSEQQSRSRGSRRSDFQRGWIEWTPRWGVKLHGPVNIDDGTELNPADG